MSVRNLDSLFKPRSIAVIGASNSPRSVGGIVMRNLLQGGFEGAIMPVNPKYQSVAGVLTYPDVPSLPITPDCAIICTGPQTVPDLITQLGERGTRGAVVITAGLAGMIYRDGRTIQDAMLANAKPHGLRIMGPNCVGLLLPPLKLNASFAHTTIASGSIAFVSQSGGFCTATIDWAKARGIGFSHFISTGDAADVDFGDVLDYLASEKDVSAILVYMESIGADEARKFMSAARAASRNKPVIAIKAGRNAEGARAAASHTGALAGADNVYDAALRRAGILRVYDLDELFDAVETLARAKRLRGDRLAILTNGGGPGVIATDALIEQGGTLAKLSDETMQQLNDLLPGNWSHANPIDMIGDADATTYVRTLEILLKDDGIDGILVMNAPSAIAPPESSAAGIVNTVREAKLPILTTWVGGEAAGRARKIFSDNEIPTYDTPEHAIRAFMHMVRFRRNQRILTEVPPSAPTDFNTSPAAARGVIEKALLENRELLTEPEAKQVLAAYGVPVVETRVANDTEQVAELTRQIGPPVALKILSPDITHKSDVGGVVLGLNDPDEAKAAAEAMLKRVEKTFPAAHIAGFTVQKMAKRPNAQELIIGMTCDNIFGPILLFGRGGTAVEVIGDRDVALPPLNMNLARNVIERTQVYKLLKGYRDKPPADLEAICLTLHQISQLLVDRPEIIELDINPLFADDEGVLALDARIRVAPATSSGAERLAIRPYPRELEQTVELGELGPVMLRPIRPEDEPAHEVFVSRLTPEDLHFRLLGAAREIPQKELARLTQIDYDRDMAFIATIADAQGKSETLGVVRAVVNATNTFGEIAIVIRSDMKRRGLGRALLTKMIAYLRSRGTNAMGCQILPENVGMVDLCRSLGFDIQPTSDGNLLDVKLDLSREPIATA